MKWRCQCGFANWNHYYVCGACGRHRPEPEKKERLSSELWARLDARCSKLLARLEDAAERKSGVDVTDLSSKEIVKLLTNNHNPLIVSTRKGGV